MERLLLDLYRLIFWKNLRLEHVTNERMLFLRALFHIIVKRSSKQHNATMIDRKNLQRWGYDAEYFRGAFSHLLKEILEI